MSDPRSLILADAADGPLVPLKGYPGAFMRLLSIEDIDAMRKEEDQGVHMLVRSIVDADGVRLFQTQDVEKLKKLKAGKFRGIIRQVNEVNQTDDEVTEYLEKN